MEIFSERLQELRKEKGLTQKQLADEINVSERGVQNYELGERKPTFENLMALADYFSVSLDWLCGRSERRAVWVERKR
jgi:transcriptional regulator with XRE-family HTH domain